MPKTVLVLSDNANRRFMVAALLDGEGYNLVPVPDCEEAEAALKLGGIDLVITALIVSGMKGLEWLMALRGAAHGVPVVALAGGAEAIDRAYARSALRHGAERALLWPFRPSRLRDDVRGILKSAAK